jgi:putative transposase
MDKGFLYLVAIIDWHSRAVLAWELSNTMEPDFYIKALRHAIAIYGAPEIFNSDQGAQFTCNAFVNELQTSNIKISRDGRGRCLDNIFVEWLWRSVKYEEIYLKDYVDGCDARRQLHMLTYNDEKIYWKLI